jgi:hypothetical protein
MEEIRNAYRMLAGNSKVKRPLGILRCRRENNIKMDFKGIRRGMAYVHLGQDKDGWQNLVYTAMSLGVP